MKKMFKFFGSYEFKNAVAFLNASIGVGMIAEGQWQGGVGWVSSGIVMFMLAACEKVNFSLMAENDIIKSILARLILKHEKDMESIIKEISDEGNNK